VTSTRSPTPLPSNVEGDHHAGRCPRPPPRGRRRWAVRPAGAWPRRSRSPFAVSISAPFSIGNAAGPGARSPGLAGVSTAAANRARAAPRPGRAAVITASVTAPRSMRRTGVDSPARFGPNWRHWPGPARQGAGGEASLNRFPARPELLNLVPGPGSRSRFTKRRQVLVGPKVNRFRSTGRPFWQHIPDDLAHQRGGVPPARSMRGSRSASSAASAACRTFGLGAGQVQPAGGADHPVVDELDPGRLLGPRWRPGIAYEAGRISSTNSDSPAQRPSSRSCSGSPGTPAAGPAW